MVKHESATLIKFKKKITPYFYLTPTLLLMFVLMVIPIVMVIQYSVMDNVIMNKSPRLIGAGNYFKILTDKNFHTAVSNTLIFTLVSVVAHMAIGLGFALMLNSPILGSHTKSFFRVIYILPWVFTAAIIAILWRLLLNPNGVVNYFLETLGVVSEKVEWLGSRKTALGALTFINIWSGYPFYMVSLLAGLQGISADLYEASEVDGATGVQQFFYITVPQLKSIIVSMAMLDCIWTTQQFSLVWMTTGGGPIRATEMISTFTYKLAFSKYEFSMASASAVFILLISMILSFFYVRTQVSRD